MVLLLLMHPLCVVACTLNDYGGDCGDDDYGDEDEELADDADDDAIEEEVDIMDEDIDKLHDEMKHRNKPVGEEWLTC